MNKQKLIELLDLLDRAQDIMDNIEDSECERLLPLVNGLYGRISAFKIEAKHAGVSLD